MNKVKKILLQSLGVFPFFNSNVTGATREIKSPIDERILNVRNAVYNSNELRANKLMEYLFEPGCSVKDFIGEEIQVGAFRDLPTFDNFEKFAAFDNFGKFEAWSNGVTDRTP